MAAKFEKFQYFKSDKKLLLEKVMWSLERCKFKIAYIDQKNNIVTAKSPISWLSWGEIIKVEIANEGKVYAISECSVSTQLIDWGKNRKNIHQFFRLLASSEIPA